MVYNIKGDLSNEINMSCLFLFIFFFFIEKNLILLEKLSLFQYEKSISCDILNSIKECTSIFQRKKNSYNIVNNFSKSKMYSKVLLYFLYIKLESSKFCDN